MPRPSRVGHIRAGSARLGAEPSTQFMQMIWSAFPDMVSHEDAIFGEGDRVVVQWTIDATHKGPAEGTREWPEEICMSDAVSELVDRRWSEYGIDVDGAQTDGRTPKRLRQLLRR